MSIDLGGGGHRPTPHDSDRYALDQAALAYQTAHPGTDYISAVKAVEATHRLAA